MIKKVLILLVLQATVFTSLAQMSGTYIISSPTNSDIWDDYSSLTAAINALQTNNIVANVTFKLRDGVYNGTHGIANVATNKHITIESLSGNKDSVTFKFDGFYACKNFTTRNVTLIPTMNTNSFNTDKGLRITGSENIHFYNCIIDGIPSNIYHKNGLWFATSKGGSVKKCTFKNLVNGLIFYYGSVYYGSNHHQNTSIIDSNEFIGVTNAIKIGGTFYSGALKITNNTILDSDDGIVAYTNKLSVWSSSSIEISNNKILNAKESGIEFKDVANLSYITFTNNQVSNSGNNGYDFAILLDEVDSVLLEHNSFLGRCRFIDMEHLSSFSNIFYLQNNSIYGMVYYEVTNSDIDYNSYYLDTNTQSWWIRYNGIKYNDLTSYAFGSQQDLNSLYAKPEYGSVYDLSTCSKYLRSQGHPYPSKNYDSDYEQRDTLAPDIGADEYKNSLLNPCVLYDIVCDSVNPFVIDFENLSPLFTSSYWGFGDGSNTAGSSVSHTYSSQGTYSVMLVSGNGIRVDTTYFTIDLSNAQIENFQRKGDTLFVNPAYSDYQWYFNNSPIPGAQSSWYRVLHEGSYKCGFATASECLQYTTNFVNIGIEQDELLTINFYPNPVGDFLNLDVSDDKDYFWEIISLSGQVYSSGRIQGKDLKIDLTGISTGVYVLSVTKEGRVYNKKIIKL